MAERAAAATRAPVCAPTARWSTCSGSAARRARPCAWRSCGTTCKRERSFTLLCAYAMGQFYKEPATIRGVCAAHTHIVGLHEDALPISGGARREPAAGIRLGPRARDSASRRGGASAAPVAPRAASKRGGSCARVRSSFETSVENATIGLHRVGADGRILWANREELELLGYAATSTSGGLSRTSTSTTNVIADILARLARGETLHDYEARLRAKDGRDQARPHQLERLLPGRQVRPLTLLHPRHHGAAARPRRRSAIASGSCSSSRTRCRSASPTSTSDVRYRFVSAAYDAGSAAPSRSWWAAASRKSSGPAPIERVGPYIERALAGETVTYKGEVPYRARPNTFRRGHLYSAVRRGQASRRASSR